MPKLIRNRIVIENPIHSTLSLLCLFSLAGYTAAGNLDIQLIDSKAYLLRLQNDFPAWATSYFTFLNLFLRPCLVSISVHAFFVLLCIS